MSSFVGVHLSDPALQSHFTQVELRGLKTNFLSVRRETGHVTVGDLPPIIAKLKALRGKLTEEEIGQILGESHPDTSNEIDFEAFLQEYLNLQAHVAAKSGDSKTSSSFLKATTTTLLHTTGGAEQESYVAHINPAV